MDKDYKDFLDNLVYEATKSDCEKKKFGACAVKWGRVLAYAHNQRLPYHSFLCEGECIRKKIDSGTDVMVGACGHAEEQVLWKLGKEAQDCQIYVLQVDFDGKLVANPSKFFYCVRCATAMYYAHVKGVHVYVVDHWEFLTTEEAIKSAYQFALGELKV
jgi:deoxycytidylate deaminase